jgi:hypothetical protein
MHEWVRRGVSRQSANMALGDRKVDLSDPGLRFTLSLIRNSVLARLSMIVVIALLLWASVLWALS